MQYTCRLTSLVNVSRMTRVLCVPQEAGLVDYIRHDFWATHTSDWLSRLLVRGSIEPADWIWTDKPQNAAGLAWWDTWQSSTNLSRAYSNKYLLAERTTSQLQSEAISWKSIQSNGWKLLLVDSQSSKGFRMGRLYAHTVSKVSSQRSRIFRQCGFT
jgi:hypothetical protein